MEERHYNLASHRGLLAALAAAGLLAFLLTAAHSPQRAWGNLLLGNLYFLFLALYGVVFVAVAYVFSAGWSVVFRRLPEAMSAYLPLGAVLMLALFFGHTHLYPWSRPGAVAGDLHLQHKAAYLNLPFFFARMALALGVWALFAHLLRSHSRRQDADGDFAHTRRNQTYSAIFLVLLAFTFIFISFDWLMSLEPEWYSTIFPVYCAAGMFLAGTAALSLLLISARRGGGIPGISGDHIYELSRLVCATSTFWAYIWFSQYMLIYYTNIPEETVYYIRRLREGWALLFLLNPVLNWVLPLVILLSSSARRSPQWLGRAAAVVLLGRWLDLYLLIMPALGLPFRVGPTEILVFLGLLALFRLAFLASFRAAEPVPKKDPYLVESLHFHP